MFPFDTDPFLAWKVSKDKNWLHSFHVSPFKVDMILFFTCHDFPHSLSSQYVSWLDTEALMRT